MQVSASVRVSMGNFQVKFGVFQSSRFRVMVSEIRISADGDIEWGPGTVTVYPNVCRLCTCIYLKEIWSRQCVCIHQWSFFYRGWYRRAQV